MLNHWASLAMSTSILKAFSGKLDIKRHSPSNLYVSGDPAYVSRLAGVFITRICDNYLQESSQLCLLCFIHIYIIKNESNRFMHLLSNTLASFHVWPPLEMVLV